MAKKGRCTHNMDTALLMTEEKPAAVCQNMNIDTQMPVGYQPPLSSSLSLSHFPSFSVYPAIPGGVYFLRIFVVFPHLLDSQCITISLHLCGTSFITSTLLSPPSAGHTPSFSPQPLALSFVSFLGVHFVHNCSSGSNVT